MPRPVPVRGVVEGFYGTPWTPSARLHVVDALFARGMNTYVYAPKDDEKHRARWRDPYDAVELAHFEELAGACRDRDGQLGFAISPGLDVAYDDDADRDALAAKLAPLVGLGIDWVVLALDDIPLRPGLATEQAALVRWLADALTAGTRLSVVPTEYVGTRPSPYLGTLAEGLPPRVDVWWTGPTVCSPTITAADASAWRAAVGDRPLIVWDNYPVNDVVMEHELHLGPYRGRDAALTDVVDGVLCNPMLQSRASLVALLTAADWCADPDAYDADASWARSIDAVGGDRARPLTSLAHACADGPLLPATSLPLRLLVDDLEAALLAGDDPAAVADHVRGDLRDLRAAADAWTDATDELGAELAPWLDQARREADAGLAALRLLHHTRARATGDPEAPDAEALVQLCFALLFTWLGAREGDAVVLGPRFAIHPAVVQLPDGAPGVDVRLALREDDAVVDRLCRLALREYGAWVDGLQEATP